MGSITIIFTGEHSGIVIIWHFFNKTREETEIWISIFFNETVFYNHTTFDLVNTE